MTIEGASHLHQALYAALEANDVDAFDSLAQKNFANILAEFGAWKTVPETIRADQKAVVRYVESLVAIAQAFEDAGVPALIEQLVGSNETNPLVQWNRRFSNAQALSEAGEYNGSNDQLEEILVEMQGATGNAVVNLRPKILGRLGFNALHKQNFAAALDYTAQAYDASMTAEDEEGIVAYYENLMSLRMVQTIAVEPERGQGLLDVRRLIVRAQNSADAGRYQSSIGMLSQALSVIQSMKDDELFRALLPKTYGLLGFNEYKLGKMTISREYSVLALKEADTIGDTDGVRIYTANLERIDSG